MTGDIVVSERFEHFVARHGFTNMQLTPTEKFTFDFYPPRPDPSTPKASA